ncbi:32392_t:CDS:2, partial [Racocetra persica]
IIATMTTFFTSSNTTTQIAENKIIELQEKLNEQKKLNEQSSLINSNIVPLVLRPTQDNIEGFFISKISLAKVFKLNNKTICEVKKTFGLLFDNYNIPKNYTISKINPVMIKKWLAILHSQYKEYFEDNIWVYEEIIKQVMQDYNKVNMDMNIEDDYSNTRENYENTSHILNNDEINVINTDTDDNNSDSNNQENYEEIRHILNNDTRLDDMITSSNNENLLPSYDEFFIKRT